MDWRLLALFCFIGSVLAEKPLLRPQHTSVDKFENESYVVSCYKESAVPETFTWTAPNKSIIPTVGRVHMEDKGAKIGQTLLFDHIQLSDRGQYTCTSESKETVFFKLNVFRTSKFINTPTKHRVKEFQSTVIKCEVDADPVPQISWQKNGKFVDVSGSRYLLETKGLKILNASRSDSGVYTCRAMQGSRDNSFTQTVDITLKVEHKPEWKEQVEGPTVVYGYVTGETNLTCEAIAQPEANYTWSKNNKEVRFLNYNATEILEADKSVLKFHIHNESVFGNYQCQARNKFGTISQIFELRKGEKPEAPTGVTVVQPTVHTAELKIDSDVPDLVGYRVQFVIKLPAQDVSWVQPEYQDLPKTENNHYIITDLLENTSYTVRVASRSPAGLSDYTTSTYEFRTLKVGDMTTGSSTVTVCWVVMSLIPIVLLIAVH